MSYDPRVSQRLRRDTTRDWFLIAAANSNPQDQRLAGWRSGDSGSDDGALISDAIATINAIGGGLLSLAPGTFSVKTPIVPKTKVHVRGSGPEATILTQADGANTDIIQSDGFASLTGTDSSGGVYGCSFGNLTIDGNKANNSIGWGARMYGYDWRAHDFVIRNCPSGGLYSEWSSSAGSPSPNSLESFVSRFKIHSNGGHGIHWKGPHDSVLDVGGVYSNNGRGVFLDAGGVGTQFRTVHTWNLSTNKVQTHGFYLNELGFCVGCEAEGATTSQVLILKNGTQWRAGWIYGPASEANRVGVEIGDGSNSPIGWIVDGYIAGCDLGALKITADGGRGLYMAVVSQSAGPALSGSPHASTNYWPNIAASGGGTGAAGPQITGTMLLKSNSLLQFAEGVNMKAGTATGTSLGTAANELVGMHGSKVAQQTVTGSRAGNAALADLLAKLAAKGIIVDGTGA